MRLLLFAVIAGPLAFWFGDSFDFNLCIKPTLELRCPRFADVESVVVIGTPTNTGTATNTPTATPTPTVTPTPTDTTAPNFVVNSEGDGVDANSGDGICETSTPGECTLRAAVEQANADGGSRVIHFDIPTPGPHTITIGSEIGIGAANITVDGGTQPGGATCGSLWDGISPVYLIKVDANGGSYNAVSLAGTGGLVRGLWAIGASGGNASFGVVGNSNIIRCSKATDSDKGIRVGGTDNIIGGDWPGAGVVAGNNTDETLPILDGGDRTIIQGSFLCVQEDGFTGFSTCGTGINVEGADDCVIGGASTVWAKNLIDWGISLGIDPSPDSTGTEIVNNYLGVDRDAQPTLCNGPYPPIVLVNESSTTITDNLTCPPTPTETPTPTPVPFTGCCGFGGPGTNDFDVSCLDNNTGMPGATCEDSAAAINSTPTPYHNPDAECTPGADPFGSCPMP